MSRKQTRHRHGKLVNDVLYHCYAYLDAPVRLEELAETYGVSPFHLHRIFKEETGRTLQESLRLIRLQKAANLLLTNTHATISDVARACGYASHASFIKAFKTQYACTPKAWRSGVYAEYAARILSSSSSASLSTADFAGLTPDIRRLPARRLAYLRHWGYNRSIETTWRRLLTWADEEGLSESTTLQIGLHHDNPVITPLASCAYVAGVLLPESMEVNRGIGELVIPEGRHAVFSVEGRYGDVLRLLTYVYGDWLPQSGYETKALPAYALYRKNHFIRADSRFALDFCVPVTVG